MPFGDLSLDAPAKPNKGQEGGACNVRSCQAEPALWWNHGSHAWYCDGCAVQIGGDHVNEAGWYRDFPRFFPRQERFPQFETREMMDARERVERTSPATIAPRQQGKTDYAGLEERVLASLASPEDRRYYVVTNQHVNRQQRRAAERAERKRLRQRS